MCKRHLVSLLLVFLAPLGHPEGVTGQDWTRAHTWEVGVVGSHGLTGGEGFGGSGTGVVVTGFLAHQLIPSIEGRAGVSLTAVKAPWLSDADNEYLSVFVGSVVYSSGSGVPGATPFIGGRMLLVSDLRDEYGVGWGIGAMPGVRWQLGGFVGLELALDVQWVQLPHEYSPTLIPHNSPRQEPMVDWQSGYSITFGVACVLGV